LSTRGTKVLCPKNKKYLLGEQEILHPRNKSDLLREQENNAPEEQLSSHSRNKK
jgi:hypothetical protein